MCIGVSQKKVSPKSEDFCLNSDISTGCWLSCDIPFSNRLLGRERIERHRCKIQWLYGWAAAVRDCASANVRFCLKYASISRLASITPYPGYTRPVYGYKARPNYGCTTTLLIRHRPLQFFRSHPLSQVFPETLSARWREAHLSSS